MAQSSNRTNEGIETAATLSLARLAEQTQLDFELDFFGGILQRHAGYMDILRAQGNNLTLKGRYADGLEVDRKLIHLRPTTPWPTITSPARTHCSKRPIKP